MSWKKISERKDKQGGIWKTYKNDKTGERIQERINPDGSSSIFKDGEKVNKTTK